MEDFRSTVAVTSSTSFLAFLEEHTLKASNLRGYDIEDSQLLLIARDVFISRAP
jgi:hypothetical protein